MRQICLQPGADLSGFKQAARRLIADNVSPCDVLWSGDTEPSLFEMAPAFASTKNAPAFSIPRALAELTQAVICHSDPERYALLYETLYRTAHGERSLLENASDPLVHRLFRMEKSVRRDIHKMHAFLRFRSIQSDDGKERLVAWFEPDHFILEASAQFFIDRFRCFDWAILTPLGSLHWDGKRLEHGTALPRESVMPDRFEASWQIYFENIFNPARLNVKAMLTEMPKKYWRNLPETQAVSSLVRSATARVNKMVMQAPTLSRKPKLAERSLAPDHKPQSLEELNAIISAAEPMVQGSPHAVLGEGPLNAEIVFVGEQPGDMEDQLGRPFVGPAGQLLDRVMAEAHIDRKKIYVTNAVKHFKYEQRGKRRLHQSPTAGEISKYRWWLKQELELIKPKLVVTLGASAALAVKGKAISVTRYRGPMDFDPWPGFVTVHPSYLLRIPDEAAKHQAYDDFRKDLIAIHDLAEMYAAAE